MIFFGTSAFAVPTLEQVAASAHPVVLCVTQPDRPQGRGLEVAASPVKHAALQLNLPLAQPVRVDVEPLTSFQPDVGVVAAYGQLIPRSLLELPKHGMLGVHPSLLPKYRGAAPVAWAIRNGESVTGVTIFRLNEQLDAGAMLLQQAVPIDPTEDAEQLTGRLAHFGATLLVRALDLLAAGRPTWTPQDAAQATLAPKFTKGDGQIDWRQSAETITRLVRATVPWPGATTHWQGSPLKIWNALPVPSVPATVVAGTVVRVDATAIAVAAGQGVVEIREVQPPGRRRMSVKEFLAGHPVRAGERFGNDTQQATTNKK